MALRFYLMPWTRLDVDAIPNEGPRYVHRRVPNPDALPELAGVPGHYYRLGDEMIGLVALDVTPEQHAALAALADATAVPANLDNTLGANVVTVQTRLEAYRIPADDLQATDTYRHVVRRFKRVALVAQRLRGMRLGRLFSDGVTLNTTMAELSAAKRNGLANACGSLGVSTAGFDGSTTVREVLKRVAATVLEVGV